MRKQLSFYAGIFLPVVLFFTVTLQAQTKTFDSLAIAALKQQVLPMVAGKEKQVQEMVDMIFSFGELGFQEVETSKYITDILAKNGFSIEKGVSGIPTAWFAKMGQRQPGDSAGQRYRLYSQGIPETGCGV